jgi:hypothetical protein
LLDVGFGEVVTAVEVLEGITVAVVVVCVDAAEATAPTPLPFSTFVFSSSTSAPPFCFVRFRNVGDSTSETLALIV